MERAVEQQHSNRVVEEAEEEDGVDAVGGEAEEQGEPWGEAKRLGGGGEQNHG